MLGYSEQEVFANVNTICFDENPKDRDLQKRARDHVLAIRIAFTGMSVILLLLLSIITLLCQ